LLRIGFYLWGYIPVIKQVSNIPNDGHFKVVPLHHWQRLAEQL